MNISNSKKSFLAGILASLGLFILYTIILSIANSFSHAINQFFMLWYWMTPLILGFGLQIGLFVYSKGIISQRQAGVTAGIAASGGVSTASMVACCLHHVSDILPIIGLSAATLFLNQFQTGFLALGIASNLFGIAFMLYHMQKHRLFMQGGYLDRVLAVAPMKKILYIVTIVGALFVLTIFLLSI